MSPRAAARAAELAPAPPAMGPAGLDSDLENALLAGLSDATDDSFEGPEGGAPALDFDGGRAPEEGVNERRADEPRTHPASSRHSSDPEPVSGEEDPIGLPAEPAGRPVDGDDPLADPGLAEGSDRLPEAVRSETADPGVEERLELLAELDLEPAAVVGRNAGEDLEHALRAGLDPGPQPARVPPLASRSEEAEPDLAGEEEAGDGLLSWKDEEENDPFPSTASEDVLADTMEDGPSLVDSVMLGDAAAPEEEPARGEVALGDGSAAWPDGTAPEPEEPEAGAAPGSVAEADAGTGLPAVEPAPFAAAPAPDAEPDADAPAPFAFATDPESERALREGLSDHPFPQVWPGDLRTAVATLGAGHAPRLLFVDCDETPYPAGAIHDLASVCEVGTEVIAFGSNPTARFSREILLAGVSDYLVKPLTAGAVRAAAARAAGGANAAALGGWSVGFAGSGGSGSTTLAAATALLAAERGRYVSVLDLDRTFPALAFFLDVEPASGLVDVLGTAARASLHPEMVDAMRAKRSDRISVYGYSWNAVPAPPPPVWAVCELLQELQHRSHLVIVDGLNDPATRLALLAVTDGRVLVVEPTGTGAPAAARLLDRLGPMAGPERAALVVQNHTRAGKAKAGVKALRNAGVESAPDVVVPFEPNLPAVTDRGWPNDRLPKPLRKPLDVLVERILAGERTASGAEDRTGTGLAAARAVV